VELKNCMESLVWERLDSVLRAYPEMCTCQKCRNDVVALALNALPPRYVVTFAGETYTKVHSLEQQFGIDIVAALTNAIDIVSRKQQHEKK